LQFVERPGMVGLSPEEDVIDVVVIFGVVIGWVVMGGVVVGVPVDTVPTTQ
jgi:hypothetical protein